MKKTLLFSAAAALMMSLSANAQAETAYGLMSGYPSWSVCSYDFAQLGSTKATKLFSTTLGNVMAAASVGDCYYAYGTVVDLETYDETVVFASINMQDQETVIIQELGSAYSEHPFSITDLAYDGTDLYGIQENNVWDEELQNVVYGTSLVKVNVADGSCEPVGHIDAPCWGLTSADGNLYVVKQGNLKGWSYLFDLCQVNADCSLTPLTNNTEVATYQTMPSHAVTAPDGTFYFFGSSTPYRMNVADGTVEALDNVTAYQSYAGTTFTASTQSASASEGGEDEAPVTRLLVAVSSYGDYMGAARDTDLTSQRLYFYNENLQVVATVDNAADLGSKYLYAQYYNPYRYDENGNLVAKEAYQYGLYNYGDRVMHQAAGTVTYEYDAMGNCIKSVEGQNWSEFEYDADGNCVKESRFVNGAVGKTLEYSDFSAGKNKPAKVVSTHVQPSFTGEYYEETRTYDANGNLVKAVRVCNRDYVEDHGFWQITTSAGDFMQEEHWTYDGKQVMLYEKFNNQDEETGELLPYLKTVYTIKDENTIGQQTYTAFGGEWYKSGVYQEETYLEFSGMTDVTALQLVRVEKTESGINDAEVEFTVPAIANFNTNVCFNIYRNGELVRSLPLMDVFEEDSDVVINEENGNLVYTDREIKSGSYEYFVQTMVVSGIQDGLADDVDPGFNVEPLTYTGYCASNIVAADLTLDLPVATDIRVLANEKDANDYNYVTVGFTLPAEAADYGFVANELIVGNAQIGEESSKDIEVAALHCTLSEDKANVCILTRYQYGNALSERVEIDVNNIATIEQIEQLDRAHMLVFDVNGRQVNAPLETLHGNYIVVSGKTAYKVVLK